MDAYLMLTVFPDVKPGLEALKKPGLRLAILSNGEPKMIDARAAAGSNRRSSTMIGRPGYDRSQCHDTLSLV
jgi:phosphoglycolate phosphatase-like HAD superfamily hydrolase